jgi:hypothetical protein
MTPRAKYIREQVVKAEEELANRQGELDLLERTCPHEWDPIDPRVDVRKAYTIPAVELGVDSTPEHHVPEKRTVFHRRQCFHCGMIEETTKTKVKKVSHEPDFGNHDRA